MNGAQWKMFKAMVKAATGVKHTYRYRVIGDTITSGTTEYKLLMITDDEPDYDVTPTVSTGCETETNSRLTGIDLLINLAPATAGTQVEWALYKDPDSIWNGATVTPATLFTNDVTADTMMFRKYCMAYGFFRSTASKESRTQKVRISRAALGRSGTMKDGDSLWLVVTAGAANVTLDYVGRIWTRK